MPEPNSVTDTLDLVLRKYGKIWIWSILSAAVAAQYPGRFLLSSAMNISLNPGNAMRNVLTISTLFFAIAQLIPALATVVSVWYLLGFLRHHIMPILFPEATSGDAPDGAKLLWLAFGAMVFGMAAEFVIALVSLIYRASV